MRIAALYDIHGNVAETLRGSDYPGTAGFADNSVLNPPSEAKMLDLFAKAELR